MKRAIVVTLALLFAVACAKTKEGESKAWQTNQKRVQELAALYPSFNAPLDAHHQKAKALWDAAAAIADDEAAVKKMAEANRMLTGGFVAKLGKVDSKKRALRSKVTDATTAAADQSDRLAAQTAADAAKGVITAAEARLKQPAANETAASAILTAVLADLQSAESDLDKVIKSAKDKRRAADRAKKDAANREKAKTDAAKAEKAKKEKAAAPWKCAYCGGSNDAKITQCKGCGAPRK